MAEDFCRHSNNWWILTARVSDSSQSRQLVWLGINDVEVVLPQKEYCYWQDCDSNYRCQPGSRYQCFRDGRSNTSEVRFAYQCLCSLHHSRKSTMPFSQCFYVRLFHTAWTVPQHTLREHVSLNWVKPEVNKFFSAYMSLTHADPGLCDPKIESTSHKCIELAVFYTADKRSLKK